MDNHRVMENLKLLCDRKLQNKCKLRIPNIPGFTTKEDVEETKRIVKDMGFETLDIFDYVIRNKESNNE